MCVRVLIVDPDVAAVKFVLFFLLGGHGPNSPPPPENDNSVGAISYLNSRKASSLCELLEDNALSLVRVNYPNTCYCLLAEFYKE